MKIAFFDTHDFERDFFELKNKSLGYELNFFQVRLNQKSAKLSQGYDCVCVFVNDCLDAPTLNVLKQVGIQLVALRSAGFNHVDLKEAGKLGIRVVHVPAYSPHAIAEHAISLILTLNRKTHRAYNRVREGNFSLDGLIGFNLYKKKVGIIGTGKIGLVMCKILNGFGCELLVYDLVPNDDLKNIGAKYVLLPTLFEQSDIISLHLPLNPQTHHLINEEALSLTKSNVMIINTGRGALIDTHALIKFLKSGHIGYAGLDVYEEEEGVFFENLSEKILQDDQLARLMTFPNVLLTAHQGFLTKEALSQISETTLANIQEFKENKKLTNEVCLEKNWAIKN